MIEEYVTDCWLRYEELKERQGLDGLTGIESKALEELDAFLNDRQDLSDEEREEEWSRPHLTGDPVVDKWELEMAQGKTPNLDDE